MTRTRRKYDNIGVVVPARDEGSTIVECVRSIRRAAALTGLPLQLIVVCDSCSDDTADLARRAGATTMCVDVRNVGVARAHGLNHLVGPGTANAENMWLAMTDADSVVPADWLTRMLAAGHDGCDVVLGTVRIVDWQDHPDHLRAAFRRHYAAGVTQTSHSHVHGANLGFSAMAYRRIGEIPRLSLAEDHALVESFHRSGLRIARIPDLAVATSARINGRAAGGFADSLARLRDAEALTRDGEVA